MLMWHTWKLDCDRTKKAIFYVKWVIVCECKQSVWQSVWPPFYSETRIQ